MLNFFSFLFTFGTFFKVILFIFLIINVFVIIYTHIETNRSFTKVI